MHFQFICNTMNLAMHLAMHALTVQPTKVARAAFQIGLDTVNLHEGTRVAQRRSSKELTETVIER